MSKFSLEREDLARQVFPPAISLNIASAGSKGFNATGFSAIYPENLNIFIPYDYVTNKISNAIPAEFESFFRPIDKCLDYVSRLVEVGHVSNLYGRGAEYAVGQLISLSYRGSHNATFTLKPHGAVGGSISLLCRVHVSANEDSLADSIARIGAEFKPDYLDTAKNPEDPNHPFVYWAMKPINVFSHPDLIFAALLASTPEN